MKPFELWEANPYPIRLSWEDANGMATESTVSEGEEGDAQVSSGRRTDECSGSAPQRYSHNWTRMC